MAPPHGLFFSKKKENKTGPSWPREAEITLLGGTPPRELVFIPACRKESLPTSWSTHLLVGRGFSRQAGIKTSALEGIPSEELVCKNPFQQAGVHTSLLEGIPSNKLFFIPAFQKESLLTSCCTYWLLGSDSFQRADCYTSFSEGIPSNKLVCIPPSDKLVCTPAPWKGFLPENWYKVWKPACWEEPLPMSWHVDSCQEKFLPALGPLS
jgi:hypothetical protein